MKETAHIHENGASLPKGIHRSRVLPDKTLASMWDSIVLNEALKKQLLSQAVLNFTVRRKVSRTVLPLHGVIMLVGPPGTGKTSLARGLAQRTSESLRGGKPFRFLEVEPHALTSSAMGKTQRAVSELFSQAIAEVASTGPTIVLLDEVETLAADRSKLSLDANPIDVHRATDAVLVQLDTLADHYPDLLFIATSNFPEAIDAAFTSRCDLVLQIPLPDAKACERILADCLVGVGQIYPRVKALIEERGFSKCAAECVGLDGRAIRKIVVNALATSPETAMNPEAITIDDLLGAAKSAKMNRHMGAC